MPHLPPTLDNPNPGLTYIGQVCYLRCIVRGRELDVDGTPLASVEYVDKKGNPDPDQFIRLYVVPEVHLVASKIVREEMA